MPSLRIVTTSAIFLTLAAGNAAAQTATTTTPGKPLQLFQIIQQKDGTAVKPHRRARYVRRRVARTRVANQTTGVMRHAYMQASPAPEPEQTAATPAAATPAATTPAAATPAAATPAGPTPATTTAAAPANIWPTPNLTLPGMEGLTPTPTAPAPVASDPVAPVPPANQDEALAAAYHTVQVAPQATPQVTPPSAPQVTPPNAAQVAQATTVSATDVAADEPHDATNTAKASNPAASWPVQHAMVATAEPQNPDPVGSASWIAHVLAALGGAIAAGGLAWVLIDPLPARSYE